ncbi:MAG: HAD family hydrolase [Candidatus Gottesmanbacteria bacterium]|nr:HAD family hydrolase [Candidatus Gottesmanbacteria bacterium]
MKYKALFLDVDGTLVVHGVNNLPTQNVASAIAKCKRKNIAVCLATSRPLHAVLAIIEHLDLSGYCVLHSGTQIYDPRKKKIIIEKMFPKDVMHIISAVAKEFHIELKVFDGKKEVLYDGIHPPQKVVGMYFPELTSDLVQTIQKKLESLPEVSVHRMPAWDERFECLDITRKDASKLHGIIG